MRLLMIGIGAIACGCASSRPRQAQIVDGFDCWPGPPAKPARLYRAEHRDSILSSRNEAALVVVVDSNRSTHALQGVGVSIGKTGPHAFTDSVGRARLSSLSDGDVPILIRRLGYDRWNGTVAIRTGYADTLRIGLRPSVACLVPVGLPSERTDTRRP